MINSGLAYGIVMMICSLIAVAVITAIIWAIGILLRNQEEILINQDKMVSYLYKILKKDVSESKTKDETDTESN